MRFDAVIIGGGLIGGACADALAGEGLNVCLLDAGRPAREASWAGAILRDTTVDDNPRTTTPINRRRKFFILMSIP